MLCRRGRIKGSDLGAIRVSDTYSDVDVAQDVASTFAEATLRTDPRNPRVNVRLLTPGAGGPPPPHKARAAAKPFRGPHKAPPPGAKRPNKKYKKRAAENAAAP
jgi:ATP-dependent RNA helicase DeaD